jgi:F0F1-type ATP synthase membrane subunit c/vacuolar-type H+-ATPase subunit K
MFILLLLYAYLGIGLTAGVVALAVGRHGAKTRPDVARAMNQATQYGTPLFIVGFMLAWPRLLWTGFRASR